MSLTPGSHLGQYEIVAAIGAGGMGEVYRARDTRLGREVAIKILPPAFATDSERIARFQREARTLASLNHPNIAIIHGLEQADGVQALVMELVPGEDLSQRIARGPIPLDDALPIATQIAEALEAAHDQGIVHRDLKPANIKIRDDGTVKVLDFGLAKAVERAGSDSSLTQSPTITSPAMTQAGMILGTAAYMSPEQAKGRPTDKRSDIWAFGCTLYEMLTGARPFDGEDTTDVLGAVVRLEPDWSRVPVTVPPAILALMKGCLVKDRRQRIGDAAAALFTLRTPALSHPAASDVAATIAQPSLPRGLAPLLVVSALVAVATWIAATTLRRPVAVPAQVARFSIPLEAGQVLTNAGRRAVAISPDGGRIAFVANQRLFLRPLAESGARPIAGSEGNAVTSPSFSPDGQSIAFYVDGAIKTIGINGGTPVEVCKASNPYGLSWSGDAILFGQARGGIMRVPQQGGKPEVLVPLGDGEIAHGPQQLPGGKVLLFTLMNANGEDRWETARIVTHTLATKERKVLLTGGSDARYVETGHLLYADRGTLMAVAFDTERLSLAGTPIPVIQGVRRALGTAGVAPPTTQLDVSSSGALVYVPGPLIISGNASNLIFVDARGQSTALKLTAGRYAGPRISPDGTRVAYFSEDPADTNVWIYGLDETHGESKLTLIGKNRDPVWTPDNQRIAFESEREGIDGIFLQKADSTGSAELLFKKEPGVAALAPDSFSPNGETLLFTQFRETRPSASGLTASMWTLSLRDRKVQRFGSAESPQSMDPVFSPDGHWVAYDVLDDGTNHIYVEPFPEGERRLVSNSPGANPFWMSNETGTVLAFGAGPAPALFGGVNVSFHPPNIEFSKPFSIPRTPITAQTGAERRNWDPDPKGTRGILGLTSQATTTGLSTLEVVVNWFEELKAKVPRN